MFIWNKNKKELIIKSIIWKTIIDLFKKEKDIDISSYLMSITIKWKNIIIKTKKPIINTELLLINDNIKDISKKKLKKIWLNIYDFEIIYN
jgi:hypothetical protein